MLFAIWRPWKETSQRRPGPRAGDTGPRPRPWRPRVETLEGRVVPTTYTVTNLLDVGPGSLRQAILNSNSNQGPNTIAFNLPGPSPFLILPLSPLPAITTPVTIDGASQPGFGDRAEIVISGTLAGNANGLVINSNNSAVRYLDFESFAQAGILVTGNNDSLVADLSGIDVTTGLALPNTVGVSIQGGTGDSIVRGPNGFPSIISGNSQAGISLSGTTGTLVQGSNVGLSVDGSTAVPNGDGIDDFGGNGDQIAGQQGGGSWISGNRGYGILLSGCTGTVVQSNFIGVDIGLSYAIPNGTGVFVDGGQGNTIGGPPQAAGNLISGNLNDGILIDGDADRTQVWSNYIGTNEALAYAIPNGTGVVVASGTNALIGGPDGGEGNVIGGSINDGLDVLDPSSGTVVQANHVGATPDGTIALPNHLGVYITASGCLIGGHTNADANLFSGNTTYGVYVTGSFNTISANEIGTMAGGGAPQPNAVGMYVAGSYNLIGGTDIGHTTNLFAGNLGNGLEIAGDNNVLENNLFGISDNGAFAIPNGQNGLYISGSYNTIGGEVNQAYNLISGNTQDGIFIDSSGTGNLIEGNHIGVDNPGYALPNGGNAIHIDGSNNTVGGLLSDEYNVIAGSGQNGVFLDADSSGNVIQGNLIGTEEFGYNDGNSGAGVYVLGSNNWIGGVGRLGNTIFYNGQSGVMVDGNSGNTITGNSIDYHPNGLGIQLINGGNNNQTAPILTYANGYEIDGYMSNTPDTTFTVELFSDPSPNPSGYGEGHYFLGSISVTTDDTGYGDFRFYSYGGPWVSATATDPAGNTSGFSLARPTFQSSSPDAGLDALPSAPVQTSATSPAPTPVLPAPMVPAGPGQVAVTAASVGQGGANLPDRSPNPAGFAVNRSGPALNSGRLDVGWATGLEGDSFFG